MPRTVKAAPAAHRSAPPSSFLSLLSGWVQQGVESFFATQRVLVDVAMRQNAILMKNFREMLTDPDNCPTTMMTELVVEGTSSFIEAQHILLNLVQEENDLIMKGVKERVSGSTTAAATSDLIRRSINTFVGMQQEFLRTTKKQTIAWLEDVNTGKAFTGSHLVDAAREGMDTFVLTQKKFLDIISEESSRALSGKAPEKVKKTELSKLAHEGVNAFVEAQKKLLDVAGQQMNVNLNVATRAAGLLNPARLIPMANITGEGVRNFVEAEKALIDSMVKPHVEKKTPKPRAKGRAPRKSKMAMAKAAAA